VKRKNESYRIGPIRCGHPPITRFEPPFITMSLDISTGHLTQLDSVRLDNANCRVNDGNPITVYKYEEGYFVHISDGETDYLAMAEYGYSEQFRHILRRAKELGCKYAQFDRDGTQFDDLETYNW
jgi:hypothetical protein